MLTINMKRTVDATTEGTRLHPATRRKFSATVEEKSGVLLP